MNPPQFLTNLPLESGVFDTAVAINRTNPNNIVVSYGHYTVFANDNFYASPYVIVSMDGGDTWIYNGHINAPLTSPIGFGDCRGVASDKYGNLWYSATNYLDPTGENFVNSPIFFASFDGGLTWTTIYSAPITSTSVYDYPQYCFGGDGQGNYGLQFTASYFPENLDGFPFVGFIPIKGFGLSNIGPIQTTTLPQFLNNILNPSITASQDGRVWSLGAPAGLAPGVLPPPGTGITNRPLTYKSPGPLDSNYAGPWDTAIINQLNQTLLYPNQFKAQPDFGFPNSVQVIVYDDRRQALYSMANSNYPYFSQNTNIYFTISRDNGQTWSNPININNTDKNNRGFQSMALDTVTGDLIIGWFDGRNDESQTGVQYYGAVIDAKTLDKLVEEIPVSNPIYSIPPNTSDGQRFKMVDEEKS
jgi:Neuraminidase (sialidase)